MPFAEKILGGSYAHTKMNKEKSLECPICNKIYSTHSNLNKHVKKYHPNKVDILEPYYKNSKYFKYSCKCGKNFNHLRHFRSHQRVHEDQIENNRYTRKKCPLCDFCRYKKSEMLYHFKESHKISVESKEFIFNSLEEFHNWKVNIENDSSSSYIKNAKSSNLSAIYYCCHRSGSYVPKGKGARQLKIKGTNKINAYCPAGIRLIKNNDGTCKALLVDTHIGHEADIKHLQLTSLERKYLAIKIAGGMGFDQILDEIKQSAHSDVTKRLHLLTKKDLRNIKVCFRRFSEINKKVKDDCIHKTLIQGTEYKEELLAETTLRLFNTGKHNQETQLQIKKDKLLSKFSNYVNNISSFDELEKLNVIVSSFC